jgi:hypothetical protein
VRAKRRILVPVISPPAPEPDDDDSIPDSLTEADLRDHGIDPALVRILCPWAVERTGHGGVRCWLAADLTTLWEGA